MREGRLVMKHAEMARRAADGCSSAETLTATALCARECVRSIRGSTSSLSAGTDLAADRLGTLAGDEVAAARRRHLDVDTTGHETPLPAKRC
jgi:hypothetical protein